MKMAFVVCNDFFIGEVMQAMHTAGIDYYTRWDNVKGKGHGTEPHLGRGAYGSTNSVLMIAFQDEAPLEQLINLIATLNEKVARRDDHVRVFQLPLERIF